MGNEKASSNGISISFPMEAEMERYAQSTWKIPLGNPFKKTEAENLLNIGLVRPRPFKKAEAEGPWSISFKNAENTEEGVSFLHVHPKKRKQLSELNYRLMLNELSRYLRS